MLLSGRCAIFGGKREEGYVVRSSDMPLICVVGHPGPEAIRQSLSLVSGPIEILSPPESADEVARALPDWEREGATIRLLSRQAADAAQTTSGTIGLLSGNKAPSLDHLPRALREEIQNVLGFSSHVAAAFVDGVPVSFCYAASETETLWDISIETLEAYRRRGLAYDCVNFLIHHMSVHGKAPVWEASDSNIPSQRLAAKLKFEPVDRIAVFSPRAEAMENSGA